MRSVARESFPEYLKKLGSLGVVQKIYRCLLSARWKAVVPDLAAPNTIKSGIFSGRVGKLVSGVLGDLLEPLFMEMSLLEDHQNWGDSMILGVG